MATQDSIPLLEQAQAFYDKVIEGIDREIEATELAYSDYYEAYSFLMLLEDGLLLHSAVTAEYLRDMAGTENALATVMAATMNAKAEHAFEERYGS